MDSAFWCLSQITIELLSKIRLTDLWLDILGWEKTPSLSSPITMPPGRIILVHWGQKNPEIKIETKIYQFWSALTCSVWEHRISESISEGTASYSDGKSKTPERSRGSLSGDQRIRRSGGSLTWTDILGHSSVLWRCGGSEPVIQLPTSNSTSLSPFSSGNY